MLLAPDGLRVYAREVAEMVGSLPAAGLLVRGAGAEFTCLGERV